MTTFGDGSDGDVVISSNTTLTSAKQYNSLTINAGRTLNTAGFLVQVRTTLTNNGTITDSSSGGVGGYGGNGGARKTSESAGNTGDPGEPGSGNGGAGGGGGGSGGGQSHSTTTVYGGGGGYGGNGGKGGGNVNIEARYLINNGLIHANGFDGSNGVVGEQGEYKTFIDEYGQDADMAGGAGGGGGGGGGGKGGTVHITCEICIPGTITVNGGNAGIAGAETYGADCVYSHPGNTEYPGGGGGAGGNAGGSGGNGGAGGVGGHGEEGAGAGGPGYFGYNGSNGQVGTITLTRVGGNALFSSCVC